MEPLCLLVLVESIWKSSETALFFLWILLYKNPSGSKEIERRVDNKIQKGVRTGAGEVSPES